MDDSGRRNTHVLGHAAVGDFALKAEDVVHFAHPVLAGFAITALAARHDLLGDHAVADLHAEMFCRAFAEFLHEAEELVPRNYRRFNPRTRAAPEHLRARMAFAIARADPACGDADHQFMRSRARLRYLF